MLAAVVTAAILAIWVPLVVIYGIPVFFSSSGLIPGIEDWASRAQRHRVIMAATDKTKPYSTTKTPKTPFILLGVLALLGVIVALLTSI